MKNNGKNISPDEEYKFFRISMTKLKNKEENLDLAIYKPACDYCGEKSKLDLINFKCENCDKNIKKVHDSHDHNISFSFNPRKSKLQTYSTYSKQRKCKITVKDNPNKSEAKPNNNKETESLCDCSIF